MGGGWRERDEVEGDQNMKGLNQEKLKESGE